MSLRVYKYSFRYISFVLLHCNLSSSHSILPFFFKAMRVRRVCALLHTSCIRLFRQRKKPRALSTECLQPSSVVSRLSPCPSTGRSIETLRNEINSYVSKNDDLNLNNITGKLHLFNAKKPNEFYDTKKYESCIKVHEKVVNEKLFDDSNEVLRKKKKLDTINYMRLAFKGSSFMSSERKELKLLVKKITENLLLERKKYECTLDNNFTSATPTVLWTKVLNSLTDDELQRLWAAEFFDFDVVESMIYPDSDNLESLESSIDNQNVNKLQNYLIPSDILDDNGISRLDKRLEIFKRLYTSIEFNQRCIDSVLSEKPTIDAAPIVEKVKNQKFADISKKELQLLQKYEETESVRLSAALKRENLPSFAVSEAELNRALLPENSFLRAVASHDKGLKKSLDVLDRIKRHALLDPAFQEAVHASQGMECYGLPEGKGTLISSTSFPKQEKEKYIPENYKGSRDPFKRLQIATDVPLFYGSKLSVVPPHGKYGLPSPKISQETRKIIRRRKKRANFKFSK